MTPPFVSVVIPHRGSSEGLQICLSALSNQTYDQQNFEVLVVLNELSAKPIAAPAFSNVRIISWPYGFAYSARNEGIRQARGAIVAMTDSDTRPDRRWIESAVKLLSDSDDVLAGRVDLAFSVLPLSAAACYEKLFAFDQEKNASRGRAVTANLVVKKAIFSEHGLFNESAVTGEDFLWTGRLAADGKRILYSDSVRVVHPARESMSELLKKAWRDSRYWENQRGPMARFADGYRAWRTRYLTPPSRGRLDACSNRELVLALATFVVLQAFKLMSFFIPTFSRRSAM